MESTAIETALEKLRPGLVADGFDLRLQTIGDDGSVEIALEAKPDACLECLVPDAILVQVIESAIRDQQGSVEKVILTKLGFEDIAEH